MNNLTLFAAVTVATVVGVAGVGKLTAPAARWDRILGVFELFFGAVIFLSIFPIVVAGAMIVLSVVYIGDSLRRSDDEPCSCFGSRLPQTTLVGQRYRNGALLAVAIAYLGLVLATNRDNASQPIVATASGLVAGVALVAGPWLLEWARPGKAA